MINQEVSIAGLNKQQVRNAVRLLFSNEWSLSDNGDNSFILNPEARFRIESIDGGSKYAGEGPSLDGTVPSEVIDIGSWWILSFGFENFFPGQGVVESGPLILAMPGVGTYSAVLGVGTTPAVAAQTLYTTLLSVGFPDVAMEGDSGVRFLRAPGGAIIDRIDEFGFMGSNLHISLGFPDVVPAPMGSTVLVLAGAVVACRRRRGAE